MTLEVVAEYRRFCPAARLVLVRLNAGGDAFLRASASR